MSRDAGHADINVTFRIYTHVMSLQDGDRERLRELVEGGVRAPMCTGGNREASGDNANDSPNAGRPHELRPSGE